MESFDAGSLLGAVAGLANFGQSISNDQGKLWLPMQNYRMIQDSAAKACDELAKIGLGTSLKTAATLKQIINEETEPYTGPQNTPYRDLVQFGPLAKRRLKRYAEDLTPRVRDELHARIVLTIPIEGARYYEPPFPIFGKDVADKFPNQTNDMFEAGNCFATGRNTACVFHLMRVTEAAVQAFGAKLGVNLAHELNWQEILNRLNPIIKAMDHRLPLTTQYASIQSHLYNVKVAWRNEVMHPKATYTEDETRDVLNAVQGFLSHLINVI